ncbi:MAG: hypothetical protein LBI71_12285 [Enterobacteriaceae bacterium]|jgi:hypothetical protein|nr:hypothetical protein [Enterobacteriaceae bacterium]
MTMLKERQHMIVRAMNNQSHPMQPVSKEKFQFLGDAFGWDQLADDINYLIKIGLINHYAMYFDPNGNHVFNVDSMSLTAAGVEYAMMDAKQSESTFSTIKIHSSTLEQVEALINVIALSDAEKKKLLQLVKKKGAKTVISKCIDTLFADTELATAVLSQTAKNTSSD